MCACFFGGRRHWPCSMAARVARYEIVYGKKRTRRKDDRFLGNSTLKNLYFFTEEELIIVPYQASHFSWASSKEFSASIAITYTVR